MLAGAVTPDRYGKWRLSRPRQLEPACLLTAQKRPDRFCPIGKVAVPGDFRDSAKIKISPYRSMASTFASTRCKRSTSVAISALVKPDVISRLAC